MARARKTVIASLDKWFSKFVRLSHADRTGHLNCFTCGKRMYWEKDGAEAGHFQGRSKYSTRWDEDNVKPQCTRCNKWKHGALDRFAINLDKLRPGLAEELVIKSHTLRKFTTLELIEMETYYREQVKRLLGQ